MLFRSVRSRPQTLARVQQALAANTVAHWHESLSRAGIPCSPINSLAQLLDHPHTAASGIVMAYDHPTGGALKGIGQPVRFNGAPAGPGLPPPDLGQHTDAILSEIGFSQAEIATLRDQRAVG